MEHYLASDSKLDEQLEAVAHAGRRQLLFAMRDGDSPADTPVEIDELRDDGEPFFDSTVSMRHVHLPKLDGLGIVRWNREDDRISRGPEFSELEPLLEALDDRRDELSDREL